MAQASMKKTFQPGDLVPQTGYYEELDSSGRRTGYLIHARKGEAFPFTPRNFSWRLADEEPPSSAPSSGH
jgi:hypothetical protein